MGVVICKFTAVMPWLPMSLRSMMPADPIPSADTSLLFTASPAAVPCVRGGMGVRGCVCMCVFVFALRGSTARKKMVHEKSRAGQR